MYIGSLQKGGAERVMSNLADYFFEEGYRVTLVTTYLAPNEYEVKHAAWKSVPAGADEAAGAAAGSSAGESVEASAAGASGIPPLDK